MKNDRLRRAVGAHRVRRVNWPIALCVLAVSAAATARVAIAEDATWAFTAEKDVFRADCPIDLRGLNEKTAGQSGWMFVKDGKLYIPGHDEPFRGWCGAGGGGSPRGSGAP